MLVRRDRQATLAATPVAAAQAPSTPARTIRVAAQALLLAAENGWFTT
jgi:hypothetical protein